MIFRSKSIYSILTILAIVTSVYACAYISTSFMGTMEGHDIATSVGHIDHARALTMAIIPILTLFVLSCAVVLLVHQSEVLDALVAFRYVLTEPSPPSQKIVQRYFYSPRSPPVR